MTFVGVCVEFVTGRLATMMPGVTPFSRMALAASAVAFTVYAVGLLASFRLPEPKAEALPD